MINFDKSDIRNSLSIENIFDLLQEWGGDPEYSSFGIVSSTICHNQPGDGSKKLYYYTNTDLFRCYTGCDAAFDIFELTIKVFSIQKGTELDLNEAVRYIANKFGISGEYVEDNNIKTLEDWNYIANYKRIENIITKGQQSFIVLKEYDKKILDYFNYEIQLSPWLNEGISNNALLVNQIGFYPGDDQITIPHFDINGRFVGLRGRGLCKEECEKFGKYRPMNINQLLYNHPLGMNLYNLNNSKDNIAIIKKAIVFEGEKSTLLYKSYFGVENDISVACCGSSISNYQIHLLLQLGVNEIIIAFDRQFDKIGDNEFLHLKKSLLKIKEKYQKYVNITFIFDKKMITGYKSSPIDEGKDKFLTLFKERIL